jgi:hypothetical protein
MVWKSPGPLHNTLNRVFLLVRPCQPALSQPLARLHNPMTRHLRRGTRNEATVAPAPRIAHSSGTSSVLLGGAAALCGGKLIRWPTKILWPCFFDWCCFGPLCAAPTLHRTLACRALGRWVVSAADGFLVGGTCPGEGGVGAGRKVKHRWRFSYV